MYVVGLFSILEEECNSGVDILIG